MVRSPVAMSHRWRITDSRRVLVLAPWTSDEPTRGEPLDASAALRVLDAMLRASPSWTLAARELEDAARYALQRHGRAIAFRASDARSVVREALARGVLVAWSETPREIPAPLTEERVSFSRIPLASALLPKTWIEIELTDMAGNACAGERYWIKLPDGDVREGRLDRLGRAYFGDLDPGSAEIHWPDLDQGAVGETHAVMVDPAPELRLTGPGGSRFSAPRGAAAHGDEKTWIEIELAGEDGEPIAHEPYSITLPNGVVIEGRLDARGRARFDGLDPGRAEVRWPELDRGAVAARSAAPVAHAPTDALGGRSIAHVLGRSAGARSRAVDLAKTWIELELVGEDGEPIANETYSVTLPGDVVIEGRLDSRGRARLDGLDPSSAEIRWPRLDREAVEPA